MIELFLAPLPLPGEGYIGIRALADFSVCVYNTQQSHRTRLVLTGLVRRDLRKVAGSPDASHRTRPERPVLTGLMRREGRQTARTPDAEHRTHSGASGALCYIRQYTGR